MEVLGIIGGLVALYGAALSTKNYLWQRKREEERQRSDIEIGLFESGAIGDGGTLVIGTTVQRRHHLTVRVINRGEVPEYVYEVTLRSTASSPFTVKVRDGEGSVEVRPRDHVEFAYALDGRQHFEWAAPFIVVVRLANGQEFRSPPASLGSPPSHGEPYDVLDPDAVPDDEVYRVGPENFMQD